MCVRKAAAALVLACITFFGCRMAFAALPDDASANLCPFTGAGNGAPAIYFPVGVAGLERLELAPGLANGIGRIPVSRDELIRLCTEGFIVHALDTGSPPASFSIVRRSGHVYGNLWNTGRTPAGMTTQWLAFDMDAVGYFGQGEHVPVALFLDADALVASPPAIVGNGMVIGEVNLAPNGCGSPAFPAAPAGNGEIEAYWRNGNALFGDSCGAIPLRNAVDYRFVVEADTAGVVHYESSSATTTIASSPLIDTSPTRPSFDAADAGILIASTNFCSACADFDLHFREFASGWSAWSIGDARIARPPAVNPSADVLAFGAQTQGSVSPPRQLVFTNTGATDASIGFAVSSDDAPACATDAPRALCDDERDEARRSFLLADSGCNPVPAGGTCLVSVRFAPQASFAIRAHLEYRIANAGVTKTVGLSGYGVPAPGATGMALAIEYFDAFLGHYFITTLASEQAALDAGAIAGWKRTGAWFTAYAPRQGAADGARAVCRYYGRPEAGLDTHFYSASASECAAVAQRFPDAWNLESAELFDVALPDQASGECVPGHLPVYRLWNGGASSNHRYTTDASTRRSMIAAGWIAEGYGGSGIAMCSAAP
jgi:hypothetical protein